MTRARAAVLVLAGLTLAACGNVHPGAAAVVDDQTISMKTLDKSAKANCVLTLASSQGATKPDNADMRRQAVTTLVSLVVARKIAAKEGITPRPAEYEVNSELEDRIGKAFPSENRNDIKQWIEDAQEVSAIAVALGEKLTGQARTEQNVSQLAEAGQAEINKAFKANDVEFAPRFGLSNSGADKAPTTGSLSVASADLGEDKPDQLPKAQRCS